MSNVVTEYPRLNLLPISLIQLLQDVHSLTDCFYEEVLSLVFVELVLQLRQLQVPVILCQVIVNGVEGKFFGLNAKASASLHRTGTI